MKKRKSWFVTAPDVFWNLVMFKNVTNVSSIKLFIVGILMQIPMNLFVTVITFESIKGKEIHSNIPLYSAWLLQPFALAIMATSLTVLMRRLASITR